MTSDETRGVDLDAILAQLGPGPFVPGSIYRFMADMAAEVRVLRDQRDAALAIHKQSEHGYDGVQFGTFPWCFRCNQPWPCATVAALTGRDTE